MLNSALRAIVAAWLREGMDEKSLNPTDLERQSGVSRDTIYRILKQETTAGEDTLQKLSDAIGRAIPDLTTTPEAPSSPVAPRSEPEPPTDAEIEAAQSAAARLAFLRDQIRAYHELGVSPADKVMEEWLRITADRMEQERDD